MSIADQKYKQLIKDIHMNGTWDKDQPVRTKYADGTPAYTKSLFGYQVIFEEGEVPLVTCKKMFPITALKELILFWVKQTVKKEDFDKANVSIWDEWMIPEGKYKDTLGMSYAAQFQKGDRNQVVELINQIKTNPTSRRLMTSFWDFENVENKALQECAWATQWNVREGKLDLILVQRSVDTGLGICFNWYQYYALLTLVAHCTGYKVGRFIHQMGNVHYYDRHEESMLNLLKSEEYEQPQIEVVADHTEFFNMTHKDIKITNYKHGYFLPLEVAI